MAYRKSIADEISHNSAYKVGWTPDLMCGANGCPHRWSVVTDDIHRLCQFHAWSDSHEWPAITAEQLAFKSAVENLPAAYVQRMSDEKKRADEASLAEINRLFSPSDPKAWAKKLKARHDAGEHLNPNQIRCYQAALGTPLSASESDHIGRDGVMTGAGAATLEPTFDEAMPWLEMEAP